MQLLSSAVVLGGTACAILGSWAHFWRYQVNWPPIGVFTFTDLVFMICLIILVPFLYLVLPLWLVAGLLLVVALSVLFFTWEPVVQVRGVIWLAACTLLAADVGTDFLWGARSNGFV